jgi:hypothetical protein
MPLPAALKPTLKVDILANADSLAIYENGDLSALAALYNLEASPAFWAWRTAVSRSDLYTKQNDLAVSGAQTGFWNWTTYKNQSATEQNAWTQMFMGDLANFSAQNVRDGISAIFTGSAQANAQRDHCLAIGRRKVNRVERVFATGTGSTATPGAIVFEGSLTFNDLIGL